MRAFLCAGGGDGGAGGAGGSTGGGGGGGGGNNGKPLAFAFAFTGGGPDGSCM